MKILVTGGCGFIGTNFINMVLYNTLNSVHNPSPNDDYIINVDKLTYAGCRENMALKEITREKYLSYQKYDGRFYDGDRYKFYLADICDRHVMDKIFEYEKPDWIVNFAAESHVDRSIVNANDFMRTNIDGTYNLLECVKKYGGRFLQVSTDEVYGMLTMDEPAFVETDIIKPSSPYSVSKASADLLAQAYFKTYGMDVVVTRCSNNYGYYQYPEKLIPLFITNLLQGKKVPVYGSGKNVRDWINVDDHCRAIYKVLTNGKSGEVYNIGGNCEKTNLEITGIILKALGKDWDNVQFVEDRKGHDFRYAINASKIKTELDWEPKIKFEDGIMATIEWYKRNANWWITKKGK